MASKAGLRKVTKTVRGKKGAVKRSYWVRAKEGVKSAGKALWRNKGKIAGAAALAAGAYLAHRRYKSNLAKKSGSSTLHAMKDLHQKVDHAASAASNTKTAVEIAKKQRRQIDAELRRTNSTLRRSSVAAKRAERGDDIGALNVLNRQAHLNHQKKVTTERAPSPTPNSPSRMIVNPAVHAQAMHSENEHLIAKLARKFGNSSGARPLQLGAGTSTPSTKKTATRKRK